MEFHVGRLFDHVHLFAADLEVSRAFYRAVLRSLGRELTTESPEHFGSDELWVSKSSGTPSRVHLAFQTRSREDVQRFHAAALAAGGRDNGAPGERSYHPGYYAAYVLDPDGNNIEAVFHGAATRSAESVVITPKLP